MLERVSMRSEHTSAEGLALSTRTLAGKKTWGTQKLQGYLHYTHCSTAVRVVGGFPRKVCANAHTQHAVVRGGGKGKTHGQMKSMIYLHSSIDMILDIFTTEGGSEAAREGGGRQEGGRETVVDDSAQPAHI